MVGKRGVERWGQLDQMDNVWLNSAAGNADPLELARSTLPKSSHSLSNQRSRPIVLLRSREPVGAEVGRMSFENGVA